jgi:ribosome maturation protein SDO1
MFGGRGDAPRRQAKAPGKGAGMDRAVVARLRIEQSSYEILVDPDQVESLKADIKDGKPFDVDSVLVAFHVFSDSDKGIKAPEKEMVEHFGTRDMATIVSRIIKDGEIQLTTEQRRAMQEKKRKSIVDIIVRNAINPQTGAPHPPLRIENAMAEAKVQVDPFKPAEEQVEGILKKLQPLIPIRFEKVQIAVKLSADHYGRCYGDLKQMGAIVNEEWQSTGTWIGVVEIPAGMQVELLDRLNNKTRGEVETRILKKPKK